MPVRVQLRLLAEFSLIVIQLLSRTKCAIRVFNAQMLRAGLITIHSERAASAGISFVAQKGGRLRVILDARAVDEPFEEPAHSRLPTPAFWDLVGIGLADNLVLSQMDVDNAFDGCKAPSWGLSLLRATARVSRASLPRWPQ
eukprot:4005100-Pyramimonas_sp.AAC.1